MKAAFYARMSTDEQSAADSPADQVARCREFAAGARGCSTRSNVNSIGRRIVKAEVRDGG